HRHHIADRADHTQLPVAATGRRRGERSPAGVAIEQPFLHEDVESLADRRATDLVRGTELVLGRNPLAFAAQVATKGVSDLNVAGHAWTVFHGGASGRKLSRQIPPARGRVNPRR